MAFKLAFSTLYWQEPDLESALSILSEAGWDGWEGRLSPEWLGAPRRLRSVCARAGIPLAVYTGGSPDIREWAHVEANRRRMEFAAEMDADCFMFMSGPKPEGRSVTEDDIRHAADGAESWAEYAGNMGLEVSYHIHTNTLVDSIAHWSLYMSLLEKTGLCIDVSHAAIWGYDPQEAIRDFRQRLNYVHLQDYLSCRRANDGTYLPDWCDVGQGDNLDFPSILRTLEEVDFNRWVTACPGHVNGDDPVQEARRSSDTREYLRARGC